MPRKKATRVITQSNKLIEAKYSLTLGEQRILLSVIAMIQPEDEDFRDYGVSLDEICRFLGVKNKNWRPECQKITDRLRRRPLDIRENGKYIQTNWISRASYFDEETSMVYIRFDPSLKPYLIQLKREFTQASLSTVLQLKSVYATRIYLLLKQYRSVGKRALGLEEMREMLGIEKDQYAKYHDFKKRVILAAQRELDRKTDIGFEFEEQKEGKGVVGIVFHIRDSIKEEPAQSNHTSIQPAVRKPNVVTEEQRQKAREGIDELKKTLRGKR